MNRWSWVSHSGVRSVLAALGVAFIVFALWREGLPTEAVQSMGLAYAAFLIVPLACVVVCAAWSWARLAGGPFSEAGVAYLRSLPAKHIPGGLGLPLSQVSYDLDRGSHLRSVVARMIQHLALSVGMAGVVSMVLITAGGAPSSMAVALAIALALGLALALPRSISRVGRALRRFIGEPAQLNAVFSSGLVTGAAVLLMGLTFGLIVGRLSGEGESAMTAAAFVLAWGVGLAILPVPSGIGLREAVLVAVLPGVASSTLIVASLVFRFLMIVAEVAVSIAARRWQHRRGRSRDFDYQ